MSFRSKVVMATALAVALSVWIVAVVVTQIITRTFERRDGERTTALVGQFRHEFESRSQDLTRRVDAIAASGEAARIGTALGEPQPDTAQFLNEAAAMAQEQSLDFLAITGPDGALISSAHWPARFGYKEEWLRQTADWQSVPVFLKREELPDGAALGLFVVRTLNTPIGPLYFAGGKRLNQGFLDSLSLPPGMALLLWDGVAPPPAYAAALVDEIRKAPKEATRLSPSGEMSLTAIPLLSRENQLLAILIAANSRVDLLSLIAYTRFTALITGLGGILFGTALSWWVASRVTKPVRVLARTVRDVAEGNWDARAGISSRDEIGRLAADFNQMTGQLVEQKQRMVQAERVAAWRELARRLAHELKNPLFPLQLTVENLQRARMAKADEFDEVFQESTATLLAELQNLKTIVGRFSDFAKMPAPQLEAVDVNALAYEVCHFFEPQFRERITVKLDLDDSVPAIQADPEQLRRALRNLVLNAMDAMPNGGSIELRTRPHGKFVSIEVADTGEGLTKEECDRLFTPYYTTRQHGTGLGLAIVQSVVSDHLGSIQVESEPGRGTCFQIDLPVAPPA